MMKYNKILSALACAALMTTSALADSEDTQEAVFEAAGNGPDSLQHLLTRGVNINAVDGDGDTALMEASRKGDYSTVQNLLEAGADVNATNDDGETALMMAADEGNTDIVRMLLNAGADVSARDKDGETALDKADADDHPETHEILRRAVPSSFQR